ncbi:hypothetical protein D9611_009374 [Ephemerocybe angulata]|uniref:NYN domain-containing protein n=1 Tax=Ephemerocybe angulata TaxID=980116 RepID=A0A8H5BHN0_9AGAR|nr:hypothetical protein D9611_009374 [Tulosesus angulatus]
MSAPQKSHEASDLPTRKPSQRLFVYWDFEYRSLSALGRDIHRIRSCIKCYGKRSSRFDAFLAKWEHLAPETLKRVKARAEVLGVRLRFLPAVTRKMEYSVMLDKKLWSHVQNSPLDTRVVLVTVHDCSALIDRITSHGLSVVLISSLKPANLIPQMHSPTASESGGSSVKSTLFGVSISEASKSQARSTILSTTKHDSCSSTLADETPSKAKSIIEDPQSEEEAASLVSVFWDYESLPVPKKKRRKGRLVSIANRLEPFFSRFGKVADFRAYVSSPGNDPHNLRMALQEVNVEMHQVQPGTNSPNFHRIMDDVASSIEKRPSTKTIIIISRDENNRYGPLIEQLLLKGINVVRILTLPIRDEDEGTATVYASPEFKWELKNESPSTQKGEASNPFGLSLHGDRGEEQEIEEKEVEGELEEDEEDEEHEEQQEEDDDDEVTDGDVDEDGSTVQYLDVEDITLPFPSTLGLDTLSEWPLELYDDIDDMPIPLADDKTESALIVPPKSDQQTSRGGVVASIPYNLSSESEVEEELPDVDFDLDLSDLDNWEELSSSGTRLKAGDPDGHSSRESSIVSEFGETIDEVSGWACLVATRKRKIPMDEDRPLIDTSRLRLRKRNKTIF